jgi:hypothetical protein
MLNDKTTLESGLITGGGGVNAIWLEPEDWFDGSNQDGYFVWTPAPAAADVYLEQLCKSQLKLPGTVRHALVVSRLMTSRWRKRDPKAGILHFKVMASCSVWGEAQYEPLIFFICLPLISHRPWSLKVTKLVVDLERGLCGVKPFHCTRAGSLLSKCIECMSSLESLPFSVAQHLIWPDEGGQVPSEGVGNRGW